MVEGNEVKAATKVPGSSTSLNCSSKASTAESSLSSQGESSSTSVVLPPKKRSWPVKAFPPKRRKSLCVGNRADEEDIQANTTQDATHAMEDDMENRVGAEIVNEMEVVTEAKEEAGKKEMEFQVSNPISLIAIAASWLADADVEAPTEKTLRNKPIPEAYAIIDESDDSELCQCQEFDKYGNEEEEEEEYNDDDVVVADDDSSVERENPILKAQDQGCENEAKVHEENDEYSDEENEVRTKKTERKRFTKPRSSIARRPKTHFTLKFNGITIFALVATNDERTNADDERRTEDKKRAQDQVLKEEDINNDDLYSKVKRRRGRTAESAKGGGWSRCTRMNGKGWRCSNQARAGFALCEHHLGRREELRNVDDPDGIYETTERKPSYRSLKNILGQTQVIEKW